MYWLVSLLVLLAIPEGLLCGIGYTKRVDVRKLFSLLLIAAQVIIVVWLCLLAWQVWVWVLPITLYRCLNVARVYTARLPEQYLRTTTVRTFNILVPLQILVVFVAWLVSYYHLGLVVLNITVAAQLLCATILLRASSHTWQHARAPLDTPPLSDKQLPTVSILVPARNETDDLSACLQRLTASDYPKLEIIVLDDNSATRQTPEIVRSFAHAGVRFMQGVAPDQSRWLAKNFAYEQLAKEADGDVLLFCGVDTQFEPQTIRLLVEELEARNKDMISVMPLRLNRARQSNSLLQSLRYYWEICLPRRFFKRPPVLSTCWLIRAKTLTRMGGFASVARSVSPEAPLAKQAVVTDGYAFIRSDERLGLYSNKPAREQYGTMIRVRYPQLHRRLELVALVSIFELVCLLGPLVGLVLSGLLNYTVAYIAAWGVCLLCVLLTYGRVSSGARLANPWLGWLLAPVAFAVDLYMLHVSLAKYEFGSVDWKGRNICLPVMRLSKKA